MMTYETMENDPYLTFFHADWRKDRQGYEARITYRGKSYYAEGYTRIQAIENAYNKALSETYGYKELLP